MRFSPQFLDELRARLPVSEVVGRRVRLKKAGREFKGLSPFNKERSPSFTVNDQKAFWHDFSSGKHGDIFGFVMETEGVNFAEAVERLAQMAGVPLPVDSPDEARREQRRRTLHDVIELAAKFFEARLASRDGAKARGYLADRGLSPAVQTQFRLGYAPAERYALKEYLGAQGVPVPDMVEAGLLIGGDDIPVPYDRFRDRVMFPITDARGRVIAFGGRALEKDVPAKYLNSPETPLFHKGANLYNQAAARAAAHRGAPVIAVEGYVDVIALVAAGLEAAVAPLGTALTPDQLALLWRMSEEPVLCFDGDRAGQAAAYRALDTALPLLNAGKTLKFALLPDGQDPDDLVRSGGRAAMDEVLGAARALSDMLWQRETAQGDFATPERRAALERRIGEITATIGDEIVRKYYRQDLLARVNRLFADENSRSVPFRGGRGGFGGGGGQWRPDRARPTGLGVFAGAGRDYRPVSGQLAESPLLRGPRSALSRREALILEALLNHPWLLHDHVEELAEIEFRHPDAQGLKKALIDRFAHHADTDSELASGPALRAALERAGFAEVIARIERANSTPSVWGARPGAAESDVLATWTQLVTLHRQWHSLLKELRDAEAALGLDGSEANFGWLRDVQQRMAMLDGVEAQIEGFGVASGRRVFGP